ncbi:type II and III secretion system protein family protein [Janthinobacterium sp. LS2A]|uniref:type II and III secretion system protein family protein n=1 Tax=Janthinobacterium sp. LS2A TaxID=3118590 RepID=UPI002F932A04
MSTYCTASGSRVLSLALALAMIGALAPQARGEPVAAAAAAADTGAAKSSRATTRPKATPPQSESRAGRTEMAPQMSLAEGKSTLMRLPFAASRMSVGDPRIADVILLNPNEVYLLGRSVGTTNLILWNKSNDATIIDLAVGIDSSSLQARMAELLPNEKINVTVAGDTLILSGMVSDVVKADQALSLANAYVQRSARSGGAASGAAPAAAPDANIPRVINLLSIAAPQQVMLEVKVAEVSKVLVDQLGASLGINKTIGSWSYSLLSSLLSNNPSGLSGASKNNFFNLDAQKRDGLIKVLAEPNIMAISGQEASFLAGGKIFIPVSQSNNNGVPTITLEEKEFGVAVKFTPTVLEGGRINLKVAPEVSDLNKDGIGITATGISATAILPSFTTRRATTTVQLFDGQSFAIGGLIKNNVTSNIKALPGLGEVPVLGALFRSTDFQTDRSELVFIITPHLVKPLPPDYKLPTDGYIQPTRGDMFMQGKMEGSAPARAAAPAPMQPQAAAPQPAAGFDLK